MAFCKFSSEYIESSDTKVDNIFIRDFMPSAPPEAVKVYLLGLLLCSSSSSLDGDITTFAARLNMSESEVEASFAYWEQEGLVQVLKVSPIEVRYFPVKNVSQANKLYKTDAYTSFNSQVLELFHGIRAVSKTELTEYYDFMERYHTEPDALVLIIGYCMKNRKQNVGYRYILTIAQNWALEGITTVSQVEEKLKSFEWKSEDCALIASAMKLKRELFGEERALVRKWVDEWGFDIGTILAVIKSSKKCSFEMLDAKLSSYSAMGLTGQMEIQNYEQHKSDLYALAKTVCKSLGLYYESFDSVVENYISKWLGMGFDEKTVEELSFYCFKKSVRTLAGMDEIVRKFDKLGVVTSEALSQYFDATLKEEESVRALLDKMGVARRVNGQDRSSYKKWTSEWGFDSDIIDYAAQLSADKNMPTAYISKLLSVWHSAGVKTLDEAKAQKPLGESGGGASYKPKANFTERNYSKEELNALFQSIDEVEI